MKFWKKRQDQEENMAGLPESDGEKAQTDTLTMVLRSTQSTD